MAEVCKPVARQREKKIKSDNRVELDLRIGFKHPQRTQSGRGFFPVCRTPTRLLGTLGQWVLALTSMIGAGTSFTRAHVVRVLVLLQTGVL